MGGDYGTTIGTVHASFKPTDVSLAPYLKSNHQYSQWIDNISKCSDLKYTVHSTQIGHTFTMHLTVHFSKHFETTSKNNVLCDNTKNGYNSNTPAAINITILPCPVGFRLLENPSRCNCHPILTSNGVTCRIIDGKNYVYLSWNTTLWISINNLGIIYAKYCPLGYCTPVGKQIKLTSNPSAQCAFNRAGRLCGGCKEGYSLAIGSSHCIHCRNNNNLALLIFLQLQNSC